VEKREGNQPDAMQIKLFAFAISPSLSKIRRTWRSSKGKGKVGKHVNQPGKTLPRAGDKQRGKIQGVVVGGAF